MVKRSFDHVDEQFKGVRADVADLKTDVAELKTDVADLKTDVAELKTDVSGLKSEVRRGNETTDKIYTLLDKHLKNQETFKQEFIVVKHQQTKMQKIIKDKLGVEIE